MSRTPTYDSACWDLACSFLSDEPGIDTEPNRIELASLVQWTIEDHIAHLKRQGALNEMAGAA